MPRKFGSAFYSSTLFIGLMSALNKQCLCMDMTTETPALKSHATHGDIKPKNWGNKTAFFTKSNTKYFTEVYITGTSQDNGPGHVSASMIKSTGNRLEVEKHTSYMPRAGVSSIGAMFCGFVPVLGANVESNRYDDIKKANTIIRIPLTSIQYNNGITAQKVIEQGADNYSHMYAVTGQANIIALFLTKLVSSYQGSEATLTNYIKEVGFAPPEDPNGILVMSTHYHPERHVHTVLLNCTAAVEQVLYASGIELSDNYVLPASLGSAVINQFSAAEIVSESLVSPTVGRIEDETKYSDDAEQSIRNIDM